MSVAPPIDKADIEARSDHVRELADRLRYAVAGGERRHALSAIQEMERELVTLEFEMLDGEQSGNGDAC